MEQLINAAAGVLRWGVRCSRALLKSPRFLWLLAHAHTICCARLRWSMAKCVPRCCPSICTRKSRTTQLSWRGANQSNTNGQIVLKMRPQLKPRASLRPRPETRRMFEPRMQRRAGGHEQSANRARQRQNGAPPCSTEAEEVLALSQGCVLLSALPERTLAQRAQTTMQTSLGGKKIW